MFSLRDGVGDSPPLLFSFFHLLLCLYLDVIFLMMMVMEPTLHSEGFLCTPPFPEGYLLLIIVASALWIGCKGRCCWHCATYEGVVFNCFVCGIGFTILYFYSFRILFLGIRSVDCPAYVVSHHEGYDTLVIFLSLYEGFYGKKRRRNTERFST